MSILRDFIDSSFDMTAPNFFELLEKAIIRLKFEREKCNFKNFNIKNRLIGIDSACEIVVVGDIHGDFDSLIHILTSSEFVKNEENSLMLFLGDYGDRGEFSVEVYHLLLKLKVTYPDRVALLRGNHEVLKDLMVYPHDLPDQLRSKFPSEWQRPYSLLLNLFDNLPHAAVLDSKYLFLHGGIPYGTETLNDIANAREHHPSRKWLEEILWNDPDERVQEIESSPRGAGKIFGEGLTKRMLEKFQVKALIRAHEPCLGVKVNHHGRVLTVFSRKGDPYYNAIAAYLKISGEKDAVDGYQLAEDAVKF